MEIFVILILILLNGFFAISEMALVSSKKSKLMAKAAKNKNARTALKLMEKPERFLSSIQVGITLVSTISGAYGGIALAEDLAPIVAVIPALAPYSYQVALMLIISIITYLSIVIGELVPKTIAINKPEKVALIVAPIIQFVTFVSSPIVSLLSISTKLVTKILRIKQSSENSITEDELKIMVMMAHQQGIIEKKESEFIHNILRFADRKAGSLMTVRQDVFWLNAELSKAEIKSEILSHPHTVFPVCRGSLEDIMGIVYIKDYFEKCELHDFDIMTIVRKPVYIPETLSSIKILELFRKYKNYYGVVINEYGSMEGIITLHDMTENIFGTLPQETVVEDPQIVKRKDGSYLIDGEILIDELDELLDLEELIDGKPEFTTLAGFALSHLNRIPITGDVFEVGNYRFEIVDMDKSKIDKILLTINSDDE